MDTAKDGCKQAPAAAHHLWITGRAVTHRLAGGFFRSLLVIVDSLFSGLWQPVRTDALLKGFVVKVGGCLGVGFISNKFFFFFLVLHSNTLQQRNWKSCLKVGHSSAVSIETSSQRAVRFTSTGGAFPATMGYSRLSPLTRVLRSTLQGGTERGHSSASPCQTKDQALLLSSCPLEESRGSATSPMTGDNGTSCAVPPYSHSSDSHKQ